VRRAPALLGATAILVLGLSAGALAASPDKAREALDQWQLEAAAAEASKLPAGLAKELLLARVDLQRSNFEAVVERLGRLLGKEAQSYELRVVLGRALLAMGKQTEALPILDAMADDYNADRVTTATDFMWLAVGLQLTDYPKNANQMFQEALKLKPELHEARLLWADLFIEKYNWRDADGLYQEVLAKRPADLAASFGVARVDVGSDSDYTKAREKLEAILKQSPQHLPAHNLLARIDLDHERPTDAIARLEASSLKIAPRDPEALTLLGAAWLMLDDEPKFKAVEQRALALNPRFAGFYTGVSEVAQRIHRYREAIALDTRALKLDPEHARALANLGTGYGRLGDDDQARDYLNRAFERDPYDVRVYNQLDFFYDKVIGEFEWVDAGAARLRVHRTEKAVLARYVPDLLKEAYTWLSAKYAFQPEPPIHVEVFHDTQLFSIRSVGLPRLGAHGICFGHLITARSPKPADFNWAEVLWHELSHVFHIQISQSRVPRWFTEGLAVYESTEGRPEWRREMDDTLLAYREAGQLRGIAEFNLAFTQAKNLEDILVAYYHAYVVAEHLMQVYGAAKLKDMLLAWGAKKSTPEVFLTVLGLDLGAFDAQFFAWLDKRLAPLQGHLRLGVSSRAARADELAKAAAESPKDAAKQEQAALGALGKRQLPAARRFAEAALALDPKRPVALLVRANWLEAEGKLDDARRDLEAILAGGHDGPQPRKLLAGVAKGQNKPDEAIGHLEKAVALHPTSGELYYLLVKQLDEAGKAHEAYTWRRRTIAVDQNNLALVVALLEGAEGEGASKQDILKWGELGNHIAPFDADHHVRFARHLKRLGLLERARFEAASALAIDPERADAKELAK
jgi:tetratricopeptide (TPR) repeat protein